MCTTFQENQLVGISWGISPIRYETLYDGGKHEKGIYGIGTDTSDEYRFICPINTAGRFDGYVSYG
jgi:hypothetical protein